MKKTKYLALVLVVAIMMMGAGYAYWSESIAIGTTVNTGKLDFAFSKAYVNKNHTTLLSTSTAVVDDTDDNKVKVTWSNVSPGARIQLELGLKNTGTIDAGVTNFDITGDQKVLDNIIIKFVTITDGTNVYARDNVNRPLKELKAEMADAFSNAYGKNFFPLMLNVAQPNVNMSFGFQVNPLVTEVDFPEISDFNFEITGEVLQINEINPTLNGN